MELRKSKFIKPINNTIKIIKFGLINIETFSRIKLYLTIKLKIEEIAFTPTSIIAA